MKEISSTNPLDSTSDLLVIIEQNLVEWTDNILSSIEIYNKVDSLKSDQALAIIFDQVMSFSEFLTLTATYIQKLSPHNDFLPLKLHLLSILKALKSSISHNDQVAVHDLITEELKDNLTRWKITILPLAKNYRAQNREMLNQI
jgi:hypothetical protein